MNTTFRTATTAALALLATACAHHERMGGHDRRTDAAVFEYWQMDPCARGEPELPVAGHGMGRARAAGSMGGEGGMDGMSAMAGTTWMRCLEGLDLSADQRTRIDQIREQAQGEQRKLMQEMHSRSRPGMGMGNPSAASSDEDQRRAYDEAAALHRRMFESRLATRTRLLEVLSPPQRERLERECPGPRGSLMR